MVGAAAVKHCDRAAEGEGDRAERCSSFERAPEKRHDLEGCREKEEAAAALNASPATAYVIHA